MTSGSRRRERAVQEFLQQLVNGIAWGGIYALIALGYTMVYGILRLINFAHGDVFMVGAYLAFYAVQLVRTIGEGAVGIVGVLLVFAVAMIGCALARDHDRAERLQAGSPAHSKLDALITAIGVSLLLENAGILIFGPIRSSFRRSSRSRSTAFRAGWSSRTTRSSCWAVRAS